MTVHHTELLIDGQWTPASGGAVFDVLNPATEQIIAKVASAAAADVARAVQAARAQFDGGAWSRLSGAERGRLLNRLADLIERDADELARLESLDVGKPLGEARMVDLNSAIGTFRYFAGWADKIEGRAVPTPGFRGRPTHAYTIREPLGVVGVITPWNAPIMIAAWKLAPALAAGCTLVLKPAEDAPLSTLHLGALIQEAGFPPGVVNLVPGLGTEAGAALTAHPDVDKITFTGSPEVGRQVQRTAADTFKRVTLELGGKSPQIILADATVEDAVRGAARGLFANQGEVCAAGTRILVHRSLHDEVVTGLAEAARAVKLGDPFDPATTMGALISARHRERVLGYVEAGRREGATLAAGGGRPDGPGFFVQPTVFTGASPDMTIAQEEIFGPVGTVLAFDDVDEAVRIANGTRYGLAATVWTRDVTLAHDLARRIRAGSVWVNCWGVIDPRLPWGGVKHSGIGRDLGASALDAYTEDKAVTVLL
ncbi:aldehyde dehydrogenase family protein [Streptosporangium sp. NPDC051022]|uniref:aldehyde dehydrogenase family protein n=1 Tax=Streptosporangium sp. NPDC051022 TaxID=3155752 RepID=UPI003439ECED